MIFAKKKILVWCDDPPEDRVISIFAGCLANTAHIARIRTVIYSDLVDLSHLIVQRHKVD